MQTLPDPGAMVHALCQPSAYPIVTRTVQLIETHISYVFLTDEHVYKLKKNVNFGFLDYSSAEKREAACHAEIRVNQRLAKAVYLGVCGVHRLIDGSYRIDAAGAACDFVVWMKRLPEDRCLSQLLLTDRVDLESWTKLIDHLATFYQEARRVDDAGYVLRIRRHIQENLSELQEAKHLLDHDRIERIGASQLLFLFVNESQIQRRVAEGKIVDGHGDLRVEHVYLTDPPAVIDGIEFSDDLRTVDIADELSFLGMSCDQLGQHESGERITHAVLQRCHDDPEPRLLAFYRSYRATVRAKVAALRALQVSTAPDDACLREAEGLLELADRYAQALLAPTAIMVRGLSGSGKSTLANAIATESGAVWLSTDRLRRLDTVKVNDTLPLSTRPLSPETLTTMPDKLQRDYSEQGRRMVYERLVQAAIDCLREGRSVILDGTFLDQSLLIQTLSRLKHVAFCVAVVTCHCPEEVALERIRQRSQRPSESDADECVYMQQAAHHTDPRSFTVPHITIDTTRPLSEQCEAVRGLLVSSLRQDR